MAVCHFYAWIQVSEFIFVDIHYCEAWQTQLAGMCPRERERKFRVIPFRFGWECDCIAHPPSWKEGWSKWAFIWALGHLHIWRLHWRGGGWEITKFCERTVLVDCVKCGQEGGRGSKKTPKIRTSFMDATLWFNPIPRGVISNYSLWGVIVIFPIL